LCRFLHAGHRVAISQLRRSVCIRIDTTRRRSGGPGAAASLVKGRCE
jgi:hypothetical protein